MRPPLAVEYRWIWQVIYFKNNIPSYEQPISTGATAYNFLSPVSAVPVNPWLGWEDVIISQDNNLPGNAGGITSLLPQASFGCSYLKDSCGRCMDHTVMYQARVRININGISFYIGSPLTLQERVQSVMTHEMGHVLGIGHAPMEFGCPLIRSIMLPEANPLFQCGIKTPQLPCEQQSLNAVFASVQFAQYCGCSGIPCGQ